MDALSQVGSQSYSFRKFDTVGALDCLAAFGSSMMEFCAVHFPPDPEHSGLPAVLDLLRSRNVSAPCFGVEGFGTDDKANRRKFVFAKALGAQYLSADPEPASFDDLEKLVESFDIRIAIHNHGPGARYDKVADTLTAIRGRHPYIGACVDTGHVLRSGEAPHEVIEQLGNRVLSLHLKDWKVGGDETILGEGDLDMLKTAAALRAVRFSGFICIEYELSPENPVPDMKKGLRNWLDALDA